MNHSKMVCAYVGDWGFQGLEPKTAVYLTHVNYSFAKIRDGVVTDEGWVNSEKLQEAIQDYPEICFCLSVGGSGADGFSDAASTAENRERFAKSAIEVMKKHNFRGLDIDWEFPCRPHQGTKCSPNDKQNFTLLLQCLRDKMTELTGETGMEYRLSIATGSDEQFTREMEVDKLNEILDNVNIMTYDMTPAGLVAHHSNLYPAGLYQGGNSASQAMEFFRNAGFDPEKLIIGGAFYGHGFHYAPISPEESPFGRKREPEEIDYFDYGTILRDFTEEKGYRHGYDEAACAAYVYNETQAIVYDDERALTERVKYVKKSGYGGIMFWEYTNDPGFSLLEAIGQTM